MTETVHLLFDGDDQHIEDLQLGLEDLLTTNNSIKFRLYGVSIGEDQDFIHETIDTSQKQRLRDEIIRDFEYPRVMFKQSVSSIKMDCVREEYIPPHRPRILWEHLFNLNQKFRLKWDIPPDELAILLTPEGNDVNWFSGFRSQPTPDAFVQTSDWEYFINSPSWYPVAYQIWATILQLKGFGSMAETVKHLHKKPVGCLNDLCERKSEIHIKMRTADICPECLAIMLNNNLSRSLLRTAHEALEKIRRQNQFIQRPFTDEQPSRLVLDKKGLLHLPDYQNLVCRLSPVEKALYVFYLLHPDGVSLSEISDYKQELHDIYTSISKKDRSESIAVITKLVSPFENSINEKISRINAKLRTTLFAQERYSHYTITKQNGKYLIPLSPHLIEMDETWI